LNLFLLIKNFQVPTLVQIPIHLELL
jgi:hypothetical protein